MYSQQELDDAVAKVVSLEATTGTFGNREVASSFSKLTDASTGIFIGNSDAPFYVVKLGCAKLAEQVQSALDQAQSITVLAQACGSKTPPITSLSSLTAATKALNDLSSASNSRVSSFVRVEDVPAWQRFNKNTQNFLDAAGQAVKYGTDVVPTAKEARPQLGSAFTILKDGYAECVRRAELLKNSIEDFNELALPATLAASVIANAQTQLTSRLNELTPMTPDNRNAVIRDVVLDVLTARAAVKGFGSLTGPTTFAIVNGSGNVFADATHLAIPAELAVEVPGPFVVVARHEELDLFLDGSLTSLVIPVQASFVPQFETTILETYDITAAHTNNKLRLQLKGWPALNSVTDYDVAFADNAVKPIWEVCSEINAGIPAADPLVAEPFFLPLKFSGALTITVPGGIHPVDFGNTNPSLDMTTVLAVGDRIRVTDPTSTHQGTIYEVMVISAVLVQCNLVDGVIGVTEGLMNVEGGGNAMALRLRISDDTDGTLFPAKTDWRATAVARRASILVPLSNSASVASQQAACYTLGLFPNSESKSLATTSVALAASINNSFYNRANGAPAVLARTAFSAMYYTGVGRTEPNDFLLLVAARYAGSGTCTAGLAVTFTTAGAQTAGVIVGDTLIIRGSTTLADVGKLGVVTARSDTSITATMSVALTASAVDVEVGPTFTGIGFDPQAVILSGPNTGTYVLTQTAVPFEFTLDRPFPAPAGDGNYPLVLDIEVGRTLVYIASRSTTLSAAIYAAVNGNPASVYTYLFTSAPPVGDVGSTTWWQMPELPKSVRAGDQLELYPVQFNSPSPVSIIKSVETSTLLLELETALRSTTLPYPFDVGSPVPFARIRYNRLDTFDSFKTSVETWLAAPTALDDLALSLNVLGVNTNPTPAQVNDALTNLAAITAELTSLSTTLDGYTADPVPEVDTLIASYREKAADRAVDTLLEGRFKDFFGLDQDDVSYSGATQKAVKAIMVNDLPIRKTGNRNKQALILAHFDGVDYEFDTTEKNDVGDTPDLPMSSADVVPGSGIK